MIQSLSFALQRRLHSTLLVFELEKSDWKKKWSPTVIWFNLVGNISCKLHGVFVEMEGLMHLKSSPGHERSKSFYLSLGNISTLQLLYLIYACHIVLLLLSFNVHWLCFSMWHDSTIQAFGLALQLWPFFSQKAFTGAFKFTQIVWKF